MSYQPVYMGSWLTSAGRKLGLLKPLTPPQEEITVDQIAANVRDQLIAAGAVPTGATAIPQVAPAPAVAPAVNLSDYISANKSLLLGGGLALVALVLLKKK